MSKAFFVRNDFVPDNRDDMKQHDPELLALLAELWGVNLAARGAE